MKQFLWHQYRVQITKKNVKMTNMRIHQDDPTLILMSIPYGMSYDAGLHTLEQPRIRQWLKNYEKKQITLPTTEDRLEKERQKRLHAEEYRQKLLAVIPGMFRKWEPILGVRCAKVTIPVGQLQHQKWKYFHQPVAWCLSGGMYRICSSS